MRLWRWFFLFLLSAGMTALFSGCSNNNGTQDGNDIDSGNDGNAGDSDGLPAKVLKWTDAVTVDDEQAGAELDLKVTPDNQFAVAYIKMGTGTQTCNNHPPPAPPMQIEQDFVRFAKYDGSKWTHEDVHTFGSELLSGISLAYDSGGAPEVFYLGGADASQCCGGSDLMLSKKGGAWAETTVVANSNEASAPGNICPVMQNICDVGDTVGEWPSAAKLAGGGIGVVYRDIHLCYAKDDQDRSDLEYAYSTDSGGTWQHEWVDLARGGGNYSSLIFGSDGLPAVVHYNNKYGTIGFARRKAGAWAQTGMWTEAAACGGSVNALCSEHQVDSTNCLPGQYCVGNRCAAVVDCAQASLPDGTLSLAVGSDGAYLVAFFDPDARSLILSRSTDGLTWDRNEVDSNGDTGESPSIVIDPQTQLPAIVYYRCSDHSGGQLQCNRNQDGVWYATFTGQYPGELNKTAKWKKVPVSQDAQALDGRHLAAAVAPDGRIGVAYSYNWTDPISGTSKQQVMFRVGTWQ